MRRIAYLSAGILLGAVSCKTSFAQTPTGILTVQEKTVAGKTITLTSDMKVVEPNSTLIVTINKSALLAQLPEAEFGNDITDKLKTVKQLLLQEKDLMNDVVQAVQSYAKDPHAKDWTSHLQPLHQYLVFINKNPDLKTLFNQNVASATTTIERYQAIFTTASKYVAQLQTQMEAEAKANGVYVALGAWLDAKNGQTSIHIPGYDDYASQSSSVVEQFQYTLSAAQQAELAQIASLATDANQKGLGTALKQDVIDNAALQTALKNSPSYQKAIQLNGKLDTILTQTGTQIVAIKDKLQNIYQSLDNYVTNLEKVVQSFGAIKPTTTSSQLLSDVNININNLVTEANSLGGVITANVKSIDSIGLSIAAAVPQSVKSIENDLKGLTTSLQADLNNLKTNAIDLVNTAVSSQDLTNAAYNFTSDIKRFTLDTTLSAGVINLQLAGSREEGDQVTIKLATGKANEAVVEQAFVQYHLYFCSLYGRTAVGFLFVTPTPLFKTSDGKALFRYSPSYSILLKGFWKNQDASRKNLNYHSIYNPGLGVNFAALNFNPSGATELGIGGVFSLFNDFFQTGYGFNTVSGRGYFFFGLKIPVGSFSFL